jgi:hypothetical protein
MQTVVEFITVTGPTKIRLRASDSASSQSDSGKHDTQPYARRGGTPLPTRSKRRLYEEPHIGQIRARQRQRASAGLSRRLRPTRAIVQRCPLTLLKGAT